MAVHKNTLTLRILLVEDNKHDRLAFERAFSKSHVCAEVTVRCRAEDAMRLLEKDAAAFDVVVSDNGLPGRSGLDFCKQLLERKIPLPLVLLTGAGNEETAVEALKAGIDEYVIKDASNHYSELLPYTLEGVVKKYQEKQRGRQMEAALRRSEKSLAEAQEIAGIGSWTWDLRTGEQIWSAQTYQLFGFKPDEAVQSFEVMLAAVHEDDRAAFRALNETAVLEQKPYDLEVRIFGRDAQERVIRAQGRAYADASGQTYKMAGTLQDITDRKRVDEKLKLSAKVIENIVEGVMITDQNAIIQSVNPAFSEITGYSADEAIGKKTTILRSGKHDNAFYEAMWSMLLEKGRWEGEIWNRRKNGEIYPERLTITEIKNSLGRVTQYAAVFYDITEIKQNERQIAYKAYHDALTGLPNRQLFYDRLQQTIRHSERANTLFALLYIDLDDFKIINDSKGHSVGDFFLKEMARRLKTCARSGDTVSRLGGDEFTIILDKLGEEEEAALVAGRIVASISTPFRYQNEMIYASVSIGIALYPANGNSTEVLLKNADIAMYHAKETGKNNFHFFTQSLNEKIIKQVALEKALRKGMDCKALETHYQPIIRLRDRHIAGMEALVRWPQGDGRSVAPATFIPLAEEKGIIFEIDKLMIENVCLFIRKMKRAVTESRQPLRVSVNISAVDFEHFDLCTHLSGLVARYGLSPQNIGVEITESAVIRNLRLAIRNLNRLRKNGFRVSIDDFGTGYSSLNYLARLPIDVLKIDGSFVVGLPGNKSNNAIAKAIVYMAHEMNIEVVAEGVETEAQLDFLCAIGCDYIQGYIFSPPLEEKKMATLLIKGAPLNYKGLDVF